MIPQPYLQAGDAYAESHSNTALFAVLGSVGLREYYRRFLHPKHIDTM